MKKMACLMAAGLMFAANVVPAFADTKAFTVSASVPLASGVGINAFSVTGTASPVAVPGTALSFDPMTFITAASANIYLPNHYFYIDVIPTGGAGSATTTVSYAEGANANAPGHGLGWKATATFNKVTGPTTESTIAAHGKKMLKDVTSETVTPAELSGGFLRVYLGVVTKDPSAIIPDPALSEVFTNADKPGSYSGTVTVTSTVS